MATISYAKPPTGKKAHDWRAALLAAAAKKTRRYAIAGYAVDPDGAVVANDGLRLHVYRGTHGLSPGAYDTNGAPNEEAVFPPWRDVAPKTDPRLRLEWERDGFAAFLRGVSACALCASNREADPWNPFASPGAVYLWRTDDRLAITAVGHFGRCEWGLLSPESDYLGAYNPSFLIDAVTMHYVANGVDDYRLAKHSLEVRTPAWNKAMSIQSANALTVVMPVNIEPDDARKTLRTAKSQAA